MRRFELPTSSTPCWRDTGLRYIPLMCFCLNILCFCDIERVYNSNAWFKLGLLKFLFECGSTQSRTHSVTNINSVVYIFHSSMFF